MTNASIFQKYEFQNLFWFYPSLSFHWEDSSGDEKLSFNCMAQKETDDCKGF